MFLQTPVPTSMTDWCISGFTASRSSSLALRDDLRVDVRAEIARFRIDGLVLFFDSDGEARLACDQPRSRKCATSAAPRPDFRSLQALFRWPYSATASTIHSKFSGPTELIVGIRRGIEEIDRIRDAVLHGELHRVHVVAQSAAEREAIAARRGRTSAGSMGGGVVHVALRVRPARVVLHDVHLLLADHVAAEIFGEFDAWSAASCRGRRSRRRRRRTLRGLWTL